MVVCKCIGKIFLLPLMLIVGMLRMVWKIIMKISEWALGIFVLGILACLVIAFVTSNIKGAVIVAVVGAAGILVMLFACMFEAWLDEIKSFLGRMMAS